MSESDTTSQAPKLPHYRLFESAGWRGLVRDGGSWWIGVDPLRRLDAVPHEVVKAQAGVQTIRAHATIGTVYLRHMTALKARRDGRIAFSERLKWIVRPSRALRTLRIHCDLMEAGVPVPPILLAARRRTGLRVEDLLITDAVDGENFTDRCKALTDLDAEAELLERAGRVIARLHRAGFVHGDLLPGNLMIRADDELVFIDNERTRRPTASRYTALRRLNLAQMVSRLMPRTPYGMIRAFLDAYYDGFGLSGGAQRREQARILAQARQRRARIDAGRRREGLKVRRFRRKPRA